MRLAEQDLYEVIDKTHCPASTVSCCLAYFAGGSEVLSKNKLNILAYIEMPGVLIISPYYFEV